MELQTQLQLLLVWFELLTTSKHPAITAKDSQSVLLDSSHKITIYKEQTQETINIPAKWRREAQTIIQSVRHNKLVIDDYKNQVSVYCYLSKDDIDPGFEPVLQDVLKKLSGNFIYNNTTDGEDTL